ncbi:hypothetical protein D3C73_1619200 [compost metagenome]
MESAVHEQIYLQLRILAKNSLQLRSSLIETFELFVIDQQQRVNSQLSSVMGYGNNTLFVF